jgi:hypothetical protein
MKAKRQKDNILIIDLDTWTTQAQYAAEQGIKLNTVSQRLKRTKEGKSAQPIEYLDVKELGITLVKR